MKIRTSLGLLAIVLAACGNGESADPTGTWRLVREIEMVGSSAMTTNDTDTGAGALRINGTLQITATELSVATLHVAADALEFPGFAGAWMAQAPFTIGSDSLQLTGQTPSNLPFVLSAGPPEELVVTAGASTQLVFQRYAHARSENLTVSGTVTLSGPPPAAPLRLALAFLLRSGFSSDTRDGQALSFSGPTATFSIPRTGGARGTERVPFGAAGISAGLVVVYEDRTGDGNLQNLTDSDCSPGGTAKDCVRGISPVLIAYRDGDAPELTATAHAYLLSGWSPALLVVDSRSGAARAGLASLDPTTEAVPFDVQVPTDPATVVVPAIPLL